jgi:hypothetical protein
MRFISIRSNYGMRERGRAWLRAPYIGLKTCERTPYLISLSHLDSWRCDREFGVATLCDAQSGHVKPPFLSAQVLCEIGIILLVEIG